ncbi:MAG: formate/nitrite transporter family protein [Janthinobacterium lividum]
MSGYGKLAETVEYMVESAVTKATLAPIDLLARGALAGALLGFVTGFAFLVSAQTGEFIVVALLLPACFVLIILLCLELLTGNFGIMPTGRFTRWEGGTIPW